MSRKMIRDLLASLHEAAELSDANMIDHPIEEIFAIDALLA